MAETKSAGISKTMFIVALIAAILTSSLISVAAVTLLPLNKEPQGDKGDKGDTGATGETGPQGIKGDKGDPGLNGSSVVFAHWEVQWRTITDADVWGDVVGTSAFPSTFYFDWASEPLFQNYSDYIGFTTATMQVKMQRDGPVTLTVGADDGAVLFIDGTVTINNWGTHGYITKSVTLYNLSQGFHTLALDYREMSGLAALSFDCDLDLLMWYA
jgi:hypothetical protein